MRDDFMVKMRLIHLIQIKIHKALFHQNLDRNYLWVSSLQITSCRGWKWNFCLPLCGRHLGGNLVGDIRKRFPAVGI